MPDRQTGRQIFQAGSVGGVEMAAEGVHPGFIKGHPVFYSVAEMRRYFIRIITEMADAIPVGKPSFFLQSLGQIPMKQRNPGSYSVFKAGVEKAIVKIKSFPVYLSRSGRENPGPCDRTVGNFLPQGRASVPRLPCNGGNGHN